MKAEMSDPEPTSDDILDAPPLLKELTCAECGAELDSSEEFLVHMKAVHNEWSS